MNVMLTVSTASPLNPGNLQMLPPVRVGSDGTFTVRGLMPGEYRLETVSVADIEAVAATGTTSAMAFEESASAHVVVTGEHIADVILVNKPQGAASGRIRFEGAKSPASAVTLDVLPASADAGTVKSGSVFVRDDLSFDVRALTGRYLFRVWAPAEWMLKAVLWNGTDVTDSGVDIESGQKVAGIEIVLTRSSRSISGTVLTKMGQRVHDYVVVAFAQDGRK